MADTPKHGYQLKQDFDDATGSAWPLNVGQVYTTLQRLERDGLVEPTGTADADGRRPFAIVADGRQELERWLTTPSAVPLADRDETTMRLLLALATAPALTAALMSDQRRATTETLQTLTAMKAESNASVAWRLQLDRMIFLAEAELRWLDLADLRLNQDATTGAGNRPIAAGSAADPDDPGPTTAPPNDPTTETTSTS